MSDPTQTVHIELEEAEVEALLREPDECQHDHGAHRDGPCYGCARFDAEKKLRGAKRAALSSSPEQGGEGEPWAPEPDVDLDPMSGMGAHEAWQDGWAKGHAATQPPAPALSDEQRRRLKLIAHRLDALARELPPCLPRRDCEEEAAFLRTLASQEQGECKRCGGRGEIERPVPHFGTEEDDWIPCPDCQPSERRRWTIYVCPRGHVDSSTLRNVCWACYPGGKGPAEQVAVEVMPVSDHRSVVERLEGERNQRLKVPGGHNPEEVEKLAAEYAEWSSDKPFAERHPKNQEFWRNVARVLLTAQAEGFPPPNRQATSLIHKAIEEFEERAERALEYRDACGDRAKRLRCEQVADANRSAVSFLRDELSSPPEHRAEGRERQEKLAACDALDAAIQAAHQAAAEGKPPDAVARQAREAADEQRKRSLGIVG